MLEALTRYLSPSATSVGGSTIPEWEGWVVLGTLMATFGAIVWWLYASPLPAVELRKRRAPMGLGPRRLLAGFVLLVGLGLGAGVTVAAIARVAVTWLVVGRGNDAAVDDPGSTSLAQLTTVG